MKTFHTALVQFDGTEQNYITLNDDIPIPGCPLPPHRDSQGRAV